MPSLAGMKTLTLFRAWLLLMVLSFAALTTTALAAGPVAPVAVQGTSHALVITPIAWTVITGLIMPFVMALVTKYWASSALKGAVGIVLAAVAAIIERATLADGSAVFTSGLLLDVLLVYVPQLGTYIGFWQHVNINAKIAPNVGIGPAGPPVVVGTVNRAG